MSNSGWNLEIDNMFISDFNNMIKEEFGIKCYNDIKNIIGYYSNTNAGITEYKKKVNEYLVKSGYMAF